MLFNRRIFTALLCMPVVLPLTAAIATDLRDTTAADDLFTALQGVQRQGASNRESLEAATTTGSGMSVEGVKGLVRFGDTLEGIAQRYDLSVDQLVRLNPELRSTPLVVGRQLRVQAGEPSAGRQPRVHQLLSLKPSTSGGVSWPDTPTYDPSGQPSTAMRWLWPAKGLFTSGYGWRWGRMHKGIDIANSVGTPILAAQSGRVTYAGWNDGGYGYLVEITHDDGSRSLYAHQSRILVQVGEEVSQGQQVGQMGSTGRSTGPHLHFEIHAPGYGAINPIEVLRSPA
ncbi:MAG: M23 family metallopeptidase [Cyanobacteriota bacterium]|nr:M23 family metallopeptidase [Cyanobacteriota bacterium]